MARKSYLFTSESVSEGHPDKVCDRISDEIVDLFYREGPKAGIDPWAIRAACETLATTNQVVIAGETRGPETVTMEWIAHVARMAIAEGLDSGAISNLDKSLWEDTYHRRDCALDFKTYVFHEKRKFNKFIINNTKVDINLILFPEETVQDTGPHQKQGMKVIEATVVDDSQSFDMPARYYLDDSELPELVCYTATYFGQAMQGEHIEASRARGHKSFYTSCLDLLDGLLGNFLCFIKETQ